MHIHVILSHTPTSCSTCPCIVRSCSILVDSSECARKDALIDLYQDMDSHFTLLP